MAIYLKRGQSHMEATSQDIQKRVREMLAAIETGGEAAIRSYSRDLDRWDPPDFRLREEEIEQICSRVDPELQEHIRIAANHIRRFAEAQLRMFEPLEVEIALGIVLGHRHVPVRSVGAYIPGGRYQLISSALMSILIAKVAGVSHVVAMTAPAGDGIHPPTLFAMKLAGADAVYILGGVQAMAAMAYGTLPGLEPVDMLVGAGNAYVAEAKRQLFGRVGVDLMAGPTEILVIADGHARPHVLAVDLLAQAEHGPTSPAVLITTSQRLAEQVLLEIDRLLAIWPTAEVTRQAWDSYGSVIVAETREETLHLADAFAPEHLELQVDDATWYERHLQNYGSLFVGEETTVVFGDKAVGTNHTLPTQRAARYTGGLWVGKFLKTLTYQRLTRDAGKQIAITSAAISRAEGMLGHALSAELRLNLEEYPSSSAPTVPNQ